MRIPLGLMLVAVLRASTANAEPTELLPSGGCRWLFNRATQFSQDNPTGNDIIFRNKNASIREGGKCTFLLRTHGRRMRQIQLIVDNRGTGEESRSQSSHVRPTSRGYAIDFKYYPSICFYYIEALIDGKKQRLFQIFNRPSTEQGACSSPV